jgi:predicted transcriptional regulator
MKKNYYKVEKNIYKRKNKYEVKLKGVSTLHDSLLDAREYLKSIKDIYPEIPDCWALEYMKSNNLNLCKFRHGDFVVEIYICQE